MGCVVECADNLEYMSALPAGSVKLIVSSPPYNLGKSYEDVLYGDEWEAGQRRVLMECHRVLHPRGSLCWQTGNHVVDGVVTPLDCVLFGVLRHGLGMKLRNRIVWAFGHGLHCTKRLSGRYEVISWWTKGDDYTWNLDPIRVPQKYPGKKHHKGPKKGQLSCNPKGKNPGDVWEIPNVKSNHVEKTSHPCQFPVELVERLVLSMTDPGDAVLDPYMGAGSTAIAAVKNGRDAYGCDNVQEYVDIANGRLRSLEQGELKTRPMGKPVHIP